MEHTGNFLIPPSSLNYTSHMTIYHNLKILRVIALSFDNWSIQLCVAMRVHMFHQCHFAHFFWPWIIWIFSTWMCITYIITRWFGLWISRSRHQFQWYRVISNLFVPKIWDSSPIYGAVNIKVSSKWQVKNTYLDNASAPAGWGHMGKGKAVPLDILKCPCHWIYSSLH